MAAATSSSSSSAAAVWRIIAGASVRIPPPNSLAYYFPQGHLDHNNNNNNNSSSSSSSLIINPHRRMIPCRVVSVDLTYHPLSDQPLAKIRLQPLLLIQVLQNPPSPSTSTEDFLNENDAVFVSHAKVLTPSDANNGGGFSVPRACADSVFPRLDLSKEPPVQCLTMRDAALGSEWLFRHIYRGTPLRHLLTTGWSRFVNDKRLIAGDSVVFMRRNEQLFVGIRRAAGEWRYGSDEVADAVAKAERGVEFEVVYRPRTGKGGFVVGAGRVARAMGVGWRAGMRVRREVETEDTTRMVTCEGTVRGVVGEGTSPWRMLQVTWDEPELASNVERVSPWEVAYTPSASHLHSELVPPTKKLKPSPSEDSNNNMLTASELTYSSPRAGPHQTFTQLLADCIEPETLHPQSENFAQGVPSSTSVRRVGSSSTNAGVSSIRLFGKTIQTPKSDGNADDEP